MIAEMDFCAIGDELLLTPISVLRRGEYLRLGHITREAGLIYSDGWQGPHQPHFADGHIYYTDDAPDGRIYRDGKCIIDHWDGIAEATNPWVDGETLYFEARESCVPAPHGWDVWRSDLDGGNKEKVVSGANPSVLNGTLYFGVWNGTGFNVGVMEL